MIINQNIKRILSSIFLLPLVIFAIIDGSLLFNTLIFFSLIISLIEWYNFKIYILNKILGSIFIVLSFYCIYLFRHENYPNEIYNFLLVLIICVSTDIGGYLFGNFFKGPKLTSISPNKTISGLIGSYFLSLISVYLFENFSDNFLNQYINVYITSILISTISQAGDLIVSFFKRKAKIKDTGKIIPGHGGLLDRIDGIIFAFPFAYLFIF